MAKTNPLYIVYRSDNKYLSKTLAVVPGSVPPVLGCWTLDAGHHKNQNRKRREERPF